MSKIPETMTERLDFEISKTQMRLNALRDLKEDFLSAKKRWEAFEDGVGSDAEWSSFEKSTIQDIRTRLEGLGIQPRAYQFDLWDFKL